VDRTAANGGQLRGHNSSRREESSMRGQNSSEWWAVAWTEQQRMVSSCLDRTAANGEQLLGQNSSEWWAVVGQNSSGGRRAQCVDRTAAEGGVLCVDRTAV
jgi:hypothetical protein